MTFNCVRRIVHWWIESNGRNPMEYGTHSLRRTKAVQIYRQTRNPRAVQLLPGHTKLESTVRYLGVEAEDAVHISKLSIGSRPILRRSTLRRGTVNCADRRQAVCCGRCLRTEALSLLQCNKGKGASPKVIILRAIPYGGYQRYDLRINMGQVAGAVSSPRRIPCS